jgi:hypothetical protein
MKNGTAQGEITLIVIAILILVIGRFLLLPAVCRHMPLLLPGGHFDYCIFFR